MTIPDNHKQTENSHGFSEPGVRPILFSGEMVRAILAGNKTMTRRVVKPTPSWSALDPYKYGGRKVDWQPMGWICRYDGRDNGWFTAGEVGQTRGCYGHFRSPYGKPGDKLWVRETFAEFAGMLDKNPYVYRADGTFDTPAKEHLCGNKWRPSVFMPRAASRITLEITEVRVERLQDISEEDARAEGIVDGGCLSCGNPEPCGCENAQPDARDSFINLWDVINGKKNPWNSNPWVWCISFKRISEAK